MRVTFALQCCRLPLYERTGSYRAIKRCDDLLQLFLPARCPAMPDNADNNFVRDEQEHPEFQEPVPRAVGIRQQMFGNQIEHSQSTQPSVLGSSYTPRPFVLDGDILFNAETYKPKPNLTHENDPCYFGRYFSSTPYRRRPAEMIFPRHR